MAELRNGYNLNPEALWVGEVPDGWEFFKGKYVFGERFEKGNEKSLELLSPTQKYGVIPQSMYDELSGMRAVKVKESTDLSLFKTVHIGDFCISLRSFQGGFEYSKYEGVVSPAYHILFPKKNIVDGYYKYLFKEQSFIAEMNSYCQSLRDGKNISYEDFGKTLIPYPPLDEQQAIAEYLDDRCSKIDEIIAEATASIEEYKMLKIAVVNDAVSHGLRQCLTGDSGVDWIGKMPKHWRLIPTKRLFRIRKDIAGEEGYTVLSITQRGIIPKQFGGKGQFAADYSNYQFVSKGDFAMNHMDLLTGWVDISNYDGVTSPDYRVFVQTGYEEIYAPFFKYVMQNCYSCKIYYGLGHGVAGMGRWRLPADMFLNFKLPVPTLDEQKEIADYLDERTVQIDALISEKQALIDDLQAYKKSLIYEVVT